MRHAYCVTGAYYVRCRPNLQSTVIGASYMSEAQGVRTPNWLLRASMFPLCSTFCSETEEKSPCIANIKKQFGGKSKKFGKRQNQTQVTVCISLALSRKRTDTKNGRYLRPPKHETGVLLRALSYSCATNVIVGSSI